MKKTKKLKKFLAAQVLIILLAAGGLGYADSVMDLKLGLDLKGGTQLDYQMDLSAVPEADQEAIIEGVQEVIRKRVDSLGVSEPNIYTSNIASEFHVIVELAGIDNIEEARDIVGKTIQLEFKEENLNPSTDQVEIAKTLSNEFYSAVLSGTDFDTLAREKMEELNGEVVYVSTELVAINSHSEELQAALKGWAVGATIAPVELSEGYVLDADDTVREANGLTVIQITDKSTDTIETEVEGSVSARHILLAWNDTDTNVERTQEEALTLAEELLGRIKAGESLGTLALEFSDDLGSGAKEGDLGPFGRDKMVEPFEDAAFALAIGGISEIVESDFGYHLIEVYDKIEAETITETVDTIAINKLTFNTLPSPWADEAVLTGEHFERADVYLNDAYQPYVSISFTNEGGELFETLTEANVGRRIAIFVGGELISSPNVNQKISGGEAQITGTFTLEEAQELARDLNTGAIPAPIELAGQYTISASLGAEALDQSLFAGLIGLTLLGLYMFFYYRLPGLLANAALVIYSAIVLFMIKASLPVWASLLISIAVFVYIVHLLLKNDDSGGDQFVTFLLACVVLFFLAFVLSSPITMTLAGVAGVILSIGMAVDANVLIFERMREELRAGENLETAIEQGFARAWDSIRDSNFSSLITCAILFYFGSSIIRGFALNLALGILVSMFSAIMLTRTFLLLAAKTKAGKNLALFGKPKGKHRQFAIIKNTKIWASLSGVVLVIAILSTAIFGLNLGLDFTGGAMMELDIETEEVISIEDIQASLSDIEFEEELGNVTVVKTDQGSFLLRTRHLSETEHDGIIAELSTEIGTTEEIRFTTVGPTIGKTLRNKALIALGITLVMIVFYIAFAFRKIPKEVSPWRFGMSAIGALVHDILIVVGAFALLGQFAGVEVDALFITALLTIMGFSVHDTIVVFDRVRENLHYRKSEDTLADSANNALNQTMARSMNTSISTLIMILALLIWGAPSIFWFVLALAIGIIAGTYSSIFVASPLLVWWNDRANK
ncbi:MAG: SecD/SecF fusion protein [Oceanicoccus sp.]|jgi:SecD/SecF fusion protein